MSTHPLFKKKTGAPKRTGIGHKIGRFTESVGDAFIPKKARPHLNEYLQKAGIYQIPYKRFGVMIYLLIILAMWSTVFLLPLKIFENFPIPVLVIAFFVMAFIFFNLLLLLVMLIYKVVLDAKIYKRVKQMEEVFPEFLSELSLNLKAGYSLEKAIENSIEKEFKYLKDEMLRVVKRIHSGADADKALEHFTGKYKSDMMEESINLILTSWKKGAKTPPLIDRLVENIDERRYLHKKVVASVSSYKIFLAIVTVFITPAMFALAFHLIDIVRSIFDQILRVSGSIDISIPIQAIRINDEHFLIFSYISLSVISTASSIINSIITTGSIKESYKQVIIYATASVVLYRIFLFIFAIFFGWFKITN